ncbi:hypothetical protein, partial [Salmonella enterica]|uniref:hypothetical protein n=1 Tax=Salmonella enterica TaxID=28901 RepID=UPI00398C24D3
MINQKETIHHPGYGYRNHSSLIASGGIMRHFIQNKIRPFLYTTKNYLRSLKEFAAIFYLAKFLIYYRDEISYSQRLIISSDIQGIKKTLNNVVTRF